jgi:heme oxygenase
MSNLKELTWEHHKNAERQAFVKEMFGGNITNERYATYLFNQHPQYNMLEMLSMVHGLLDGIPELRRAPHIHADYQELWGEANPHQPPLLPVVREYMDYLLTIKDNPDKLMAHLYVRHMGDLSGGQMIAKRVPGSGRYYKFDSDTEELKNKIREKLDDSMADEARVCFDFATKLFQQMEEAKETV